MSKFFSSKWFQGGAVVAVCATAATIGGGPVAGVLSVIVCLWLLW